MRVRTIGHSTRPLEEFLGILRAHGICSLVDIRTVPKSRHNPQFHIDSLSRTLPAAGIEYRHLPSLGGCVGPARSRPTGAGATSASGAMPTTWGRRSSRLASRSYSPSPTRDRRRSCVRKRFPGAATGRSSATPFLVRGIQVIDIYDESKATPETLTRFAVVDGLSITLSRRRLTPSTSSWRT